MRQDASHPNTHLAGSIAPTPPPAHSRGHSEDLPNFFPHQQIVVFHDLDSFSIFNFRNMHIISTGLFVPKRNIRTQRDEIAGVPPQKKRAAKEKM